MTDSTCPACGESVEDLYPISPMMVVLEPCGHQVDERVYNGLLND